MDETGPKKNLIYFQVLLLIILVVLERSSLGSKKTGGSKFRPATHSFEEAGLQVPEIPEPDFGKKTSEISNSRVGIYFLKFTTRGRKVISTLIRVKRPSKGTLKQRVWGVLSELEKGPSEEESGNGVLSGFPSGFRFYKKLKLKNGILTINLPKSFEEDTGKELMRDRLDQLAFSLFEFPEIRGILLMVEGNRVRFLGEDSLEIPDLIQRSERKYKELDLDYY